MALGDGVFLLAEAGLLRDRCCTPYPRSIAEFRKAYPHIPVVEDVSFVADHETITAAGGARSYEPALYLVEKRFGRPVAEAVARGLLMDWNLETTRHRIVAPAPAETPGTPSRD